MATCKDCVFYKEASKSGATVGGECRKNAPNIYYESVEFVIRRFPYVYETDWCGEMVLECSSSPLFG